MFANSLVERGWQKTVWQGSKYSMKMSIWTTVQGETGRSQCSPAWHTNLTPACCPTGPAPRQFYGRMRSKEAVSASLKVPSWCGWPWSEWESKLPAWYKEHLGPSPSTSALYALEITSSQCLKVVVLGGQPFCWLYELRKPCLMSGGLSLQHAAPGSWRQGGFMRSWSTISEVCQSSPLDLDCGRIAQFTILWKGLISHQQFPTFPSEDTAGQEIGLCLYFITYSNWKDEKFMSCHKIATGHFQKPVSNLQSDVWDKGKKIFILKSMYP